MKKLTQSREILGKFMWKFMEMLGKLVKTVGKLYGKLSEIREKSLNLDDIIST